MKKWVAVVTVVTSLAAGGAGGYLWRAQSSDGSLVLSVKGSVSEEYFAVPDSYSRVENAKNSLTALSERTGAEILNALVDYRQQARQDGSQEKHAPLLERAIEAAESAMQEFEGTRQQVEITRCLLMVLEEAGRFDRWTEIYLKTLHDYPTHPVVAHLAREAVKLSQLAGQQEKVHAALSRLNAFESSFAGKAEIEAALSSANPCLSQLQSASHAAPPDHMHVGTPRSGGNNL